MNSRGAAKKPKRSAKRTAPPSPEGLTEYEKERVSEDVIHSVVQFLRGEMESVQRHLDNIRPGELRTSYSIGQRDALDLAVMGLTSGQWRKYHE
jgi:hypothetical protein